LGEGTGQATAKCDKQAKNKASQSRDH
jgi:hypothetical protein